MNTQLDLSEINIDSIIVNEEIKENIRELLIISAKKIVSNTILKNYITFEQIEKNIRANTKEIDFAPPNEEFHFLFSPRDYKKRYLPACFFTKPVLNYKKQNQSWTQFQELSILFEIYGLSLMNAKLVTSNSIHLSTLLATYFTTQVRLKEIKEITITDLTFKSYAPLNYLSENILEIISYYIDEDVLAKALLKYEQILFLADALNKETKYEKCCSFFYDLKQLDILEKQAIESKKRKNECERLYEEKIKPLNQYLSDLFLPHDILVTALNIKSNNYNLNIFTDSKLRSLNLSFTDEEIKIIEKIQLDFDQRYEKKERQLSIFLTKSLDSIPWIDKIDAMIQIYNNDYASKKNLVDMHYYIFIKIITIQMLPTILKNGKLKINQDDFDSLLNIMTYENSKYTEPNKLEEKTIKKVKKQIRKQAKHR